MAIAETLNQISARLVVTGFKKSKYIATDEEMSSAQIKDKTFILNNPSGNGLMQEQGNQSFDESEEINVVFFRSIGDDYLAALKLFGTDRENIARDLINKDNWATATSGIALLTYLGHEAEVLGGGFLRDQLNFSVRIRRTL